MGMPGRFFAPCVAVALTFLLTGCVTLNDFETSQEYSAQVVASLQSNQTAGQTFTARRPHLNTLQLWLRPAGIYPPDQAITVQLYHSPGDPEPLVTLAVAYATLDQQFPVSLKFAPLPGDNLSYYLKLTAGNAPLHVLGRNEDAYPYGAAWVQGQPIEADIAFRTSYDYDQAAFLNDLGNALSHAWLAIPLLLVLWLPGRALFELLSLTESTQSTSQPDSLLQKLDWGQRTGMSAGLSAAFLPVLMLWTTALGLRWNQVSAWGMMLFFGAFMAWKMLRRRQHQLISAQPAFRFDRINLALGAVFMLTLSVRLMMVRDLAAPAWIDSVHHALITRLILDQGALPPTYEPLLTSASATYHSGLHILTALFIWLSNLSLNSGLLLFSQVMNAWMIFPVYLLTAHYTRQRLAGVFAALVVGMFTPMPAYYASWGRFTQLAGLLILPTGAVLLHMLLHHQYMVSTQRGSMFWRAIWTGQDPYALPASLTMLTALTFAGLYLTHYRVVVFLTCLALIETLIFITQTLLQRARLFSALGWLSLAAVAALLLTIPWWPAHIQEMVVPNLQSGPAAPTEFFSDFDRGYLTSALGIPAMIAAILGLAWGLIKLKGFAFRLLVWCGMLFFLANLGPLGLPGGSFINNTSVEITLFIPIAILAGYLAGNASIFLERIFPNRMRWFYWVGITGLTLWCAILGARSLLPIINPTTILFRQDDLPAMTWIEANIPPSETILINSFPWGYGLYAGMDGGYWIAPLARRKTLPASVLYAMSNAGSPTGPTAADVRRVVDAAGDPVLLHTIMNELGIHYIYLGARGGQFSVNSLSVSPLYQERYHFRDTWIFEALP